MASQSHTTSNLAGSVKPRLKGLKALFTHHNFRRMTQLAFAAFILFVTLQHVILGENGPIVTASPETYCPFGGLETLYRYFTTGGSFVSHTHLSNMVLLAALVVTAILTRSAFCGWICPLGFAQELITSLSKFLQKKLPGLRRFMSRLRSNTRLLSVLDRYLRYIKYIVLAWAVIGTIIYGVMVFRDYDPWAALLNLAEFSFTPGVIVLGVTLVASFFVERPWCRYACPLGAASGLLGKLSPIYLKREESACKLCRVCTNACPMGLDVHNPTTIKSVDCITCLECVGACPQNGALEVKLGLPIIGK
jgi:polyferredoxin